MQYLSNLTLRRSHMLVIFMFTLLLLTQLAPAAAATTIYTGTLDSGDPTATFFACTQAYESIGTITTNVTGDYYHNDISYFAGNFDSRLMLYSAPINPANTLTNKLVDSDDSNYIPLVAGTVYYLYVRPFSCGETLPQTYEFSFDGAGAVGVPGSLPPVTGPVVPVQAAPRIVDYINPAVGDNEVRIYAVVNNEGPALYVYGVSELSTGFFLCGIAASDLPAEAPVKNELLRQCGEYVSIYILTTGEIQFNMGPDAEGKTTVFIVDGIPATRTYGYTFN